MCIEEMVSQEFKVLASTADEAIEIAISKYKTGEFVLEPGNPICKQISISEPKHEVTEWMEFS